MLGLGSSLSTLKKNLVFQDNYSILFDGTDDYVDCDRVAGDIDVLKGTISMWVKLHTTTTTGHFIKASKDSNNFIHIFYHANTNQIRISYKGNGSNSAVATGTLSIENDGNWHHIVGTWSTTDDELKLFLDGSLVGTTTSLTELTGAPITCDIGQNTDGGNFFDGLINDVAIFTKVVPISDLYVTPSSGAYKPTDLIAIQDGLIGYWKFEDGSGVEARDVSGNNNHGTLTNSPTWSTDTPTNPVG
tara:strand:+ start:691 stop:1425 length:735 start_codon:yes stop_codon:yes gene_type:complete